MVCSKITWSGHDHGQQYCPKINFPRTIFSTDYFKQKAPNFTSKQDDESYKPGPYWSLMLEISEGPLKEISNNTLVEQVTFENVKNINMNF